MGRSRREEDMSGRDIGLIGEKHEAVSGYNQPGWNAVEAMMKDEYPATFMGTVCAAESHSKMGRYHEAKEPKHMATHGGSMAHEKSGMASMKSGGEGHPHHKREMEVMEPKGMNKGGKMPKFAAGGVGKVRKGQY